MTFTEHLFPIGTLWEWSSFVNNLGAFCPIIVNIKAFCDYI